MKKVLFICFLTFSLCLSLSPGKTDEQKKEQTTELNVTDPKINSTETKTTEKSIVTFETTKHPQEQVKKNSNSSDTVVTSTPNETKPDKNTVESEKTSKPANNQTIAQNSTKPNKTDEEKLSVKPANNTEKSTIKPEVSTKAAEPTINSTVAPALHARKFDGPSFIGGIILTLGILAIGFMGFKYYKNQTERNYHTL